MECYMWLEKNDPDLLKKLSNGRSWNEIKSLQEEQVLTTVSNDGTRCKHCDSSNVDTSEHQMRSADEGASILVICRNCNKSYFL